MSASPINTTHILKFSIYKNKLKLIDTLKKRIQSSHTPTPPQQVHSLFDGSFPSQLFYYFQSRILSSNQFSFQFNGNNPINIDSLILLHIVIMNEQDRIVVSKLRKITVISLVFMAIEFLGGYYAHSIAIFADAFHLLSDVSAYMISLYAVHKSHQTSPKTLTFGYEKVQPLGALVNVAIIWLVTFELAIEATGRIFNREIVEQPEIMLGTSVFGLLCNLYIMRVLHSDEHAGGHHGCSHSHHAHPHAGFQEKSQHQHGEGCQHGHGNFVVEQEIHQHSHDCHHGQEHLQNTHHHCDHEHNHQQQNGTSPEHINKDASCNHSNRNVELQLLQSHRKMSDELLPSTEPSESSTISKNSNFRNNINMEAAYIHILTDIILSLGVILSAGIIYYFAPQGHVWSYWQLADPLCTYLFSFMAIYSTIPIAKQSLVYLLDGCTDQQLVAEIERELQLEEAVEKIESLKVWSTNRGKHYGALRVRVFAGKPLKSIREIFSSRGVQAFVELSQCVGEGKVEE